MAVMSRFVPITITGRSLTSFSSSAVELLMAAESSAEALTATASTTPAGCSTRSTRIWTPARMLTPSPTAEANPGLEMTTWYVA